MGECVIRICLRLMHISSDMSNYRCFLDIFAVIGELSACFGVILKVCFISVGEVDISVGNQYLFTSFDVLVGYNICVEFFEVEIPDSVGGVVVVIEHTIA